MRNPNLVPKAIYEQLKERMYDDSPWTDEEMDLLASEVDAMLDDDMAVEDAARCSAPVGSLSPSYLQLLDECLRVALGLP